MTFLINIAELLLSGGTARVFEGSQYCDMNVSFFLNDAPPGDGPRRHSHPYEDPCYSGGLGHLYRRRCHN
jgi:hypothetical protein